MWGLVLAVVTTVEAGKATEKKIQTWLTRENARIKRNGRRKRDQRGKRGRKGDYLGGRLRSNKEGNKAQENIRDVLIMIEA